MQPGQTLHIPVISPTHLSVHQGQSYRLGAWSRDHDAHAPRPLLVGDVLVVVNAAPNGDARVTLSCPCQQLLLGSD